MRYVHRQRLFLVVASPACASKTIKTKKEHTHVTCDGILVSYERRASPHPLFLLAIVRGAEDNPRPCEGYLPVFAWDRSAVTERTLQCWRGRAFALSYSTVNLHPRVQF